VHASQESKKADEEQLAEKKARTERLAREVAQQRRVLRAVWHGPHQCPHEIICTRKIFDKSGTSFLLNFTNEFDWDLSLFTLHFATQFGFTDKGKN